MRHAGRQSAGLWRVLGCLLLCAVVRAATGAAAPAAQSPKQRDASAMSGTPTSSTLRLLFVGNSIFYMYSGIDVVRTFSRPTKYEGGGKETKAYAAFPLCSAC